jgi:hypothetical protein
MHVDLPHVPPLTEHGAGNRAQAGAIHGQLSWLIVDEGQE